MADEEQPTAPTVFSVLLTMLGVRGSTPAPGPQFVRYGGHTSCVALTASGLDHSTLVLDAGTGLRALTAVLGGRPYRGSILLSHLHWDHTQGLPFFVAGDRDDAKVDVYLPAQEGMSGFDLLAQSMSPPTFPITPSGLKGTWSFTSLESGERQIEEFTVTAADVRHKGGRTFGYRVSDGKSDVAYLPDHVARGEVTEELVSIAGGVDLLVHDAQFVESERRLADAYGHSTVDDAVELAATLGARQLVLFHHAPARTDDELETILRQLQCPIPVVLAHEGQVLEVTGD